VHSSLILCLTWILTFLCVCVCVTMYAQKLRHNFYRCQFYMFLCHLCYFVWLQDYIQRLAQRLKVKCYHVFMDSVLV